MSIKASMVKELRERTGAGMMECKNALVETDGDLDAAVDVLRKSGQAKADKKSSRIAADGRIVVSQDGNKVVIVEINSETDFVAKDENFVAFTDAVAAAALAHGTTDVDLMATQSIDIGKTVEEARTELVAKIGENISVRRILIVESDGPIGYYTHNARIGAVVALDGGDVELARNIAMHVAAMSPACVDEAGVPAETLERERRIFSEQAEASGKPAEIIEKMVAGRVAKFLKEITLVGQTFRDSDMTVGKLLEDSKASVAAFVRFEVGDGIEKKEEDFVAEVMAQVKSAG
jgi:elongation factor Ts